MKDVHNSGRCLRTGHPTFDRIIENIKYVHDIYPDIKLNVRVNIDHTNERDFLELYKMFQKEEFIGIHLTPAFVDDTENTNKCVLNSEEQNKYINRLLKENGVVFRRFYPKPSQECFVEIANSVVIGPEGELYKCWNDVGKKDKVYGYLDGRITNEPLLFRYLAASDPFDDTQCKECILLPVCGGGCPYNRIKRDYENNNINVCPLIKGNLKDIFVESLHNQKIKIMTKTILLLFAMLLSMTCTHKKNSHSKAVYSDSKTRNDIPGVTIQLWLQTVRCYKLLWRIIIGQGMSKMDITPSSSLRCQEKRDAIFCVPAIWVTRQHT